MSRRASAAVGDVMPEGMTFFLVREERLRVLRALRKFHPRREEALKIALGMKRKR
ncbi:MAG TPA: hypothetical protein VG797_10030 [Phycisphaerales bacterium]|nr:hypothetical protein [Phycisphaerales bacterium]